MAFGQGVRAGKAFVEFVIDDKRFKRELHTLRGSLLAVGKVGTAITGPIMAAFAGAAASFASAGSELFDMSKRTGLTVESLSELKYAAEQSGTSLETVEKAIKNLQKEGIDPKRFNAIARNISSIENPTLRARRAMEAFGTKIGTELVPLLDELPKLRQEFKSLGLGITTDGAGSADALGDAFGAASAQFMALVNQVGAALAGPLTEFLVWSQGVLAWTIEFVKQNPTLVQGIASLTTGIAAASVAALALGAALTLLSANPIVIAIGAIGALGLFAASKLGAFDNMVNMPKVAPAMAPRSGVGTAAARASVTQQGDAVRYLSRIADTNDQLVGLYRRQGLIAGVG